ncbi:MAG: hypothetical protein ABMA64_14775 [Myxococcota bacterium]
MERVTALTASGASAWRRVIPLWRHGVWLVSGVVLIGMWVSVRVDVQQLRSDVSRSGRAYREALQENQHLRLELETRRRALAMEAEARRLGLVDDVERRAVDLTPDRLAAVVAP